MDWVILFTKLRFVPMGWKVQTLQMIFEVCTHLLLLQLRYGLDNLFQKKSLSA